MRRGDIVLVADRAGGDYAGKPRPAVVVQSELFQDTGSIAVCLLTTQPTGAPLLRIPLESTATSGLNRPSRIAVEKLTTVRRDRIGARIGRLTDDETLALNRSLAVFLGFGWRSRPASVSGGAGAARFLSMLRSISSEVLAEKSPNRLLATSRW